MDGLPWQAITAASGGWILLGVAVTMLLTGKGIVSAREAKSYLDRAEKAEDNVARLTKTLAETTAIGQLQKALVVAKQKAAAEIEDSIDVEAIGGL